MKLPKLQIALLTAVVALVASDSFARGSSANGCDNLSSEQTAEAMRILRASGTYYSASDRDCRAPIQVELALKMGHGQIRDSIDKIYIPASNPSKIVNLAALVSNCKPDEVERHCPTAEGP